MIKKLKANKGFTLIELIVVIAVIGILVLLAAPKLLGYTEDAKVAQIKADVKTNEDIIETQRVSNDELFDDWDSIDKVELEEYKDYKSLYDKKGVVKSSYELEDDIYLVHSDSVNSKLKGNFYVSEGGKVFYHDENMPGNNDSEEPQEDITALCEEHMASDEDFSGENDGEFKYTGSEQIVCIPHVIKGEDVTSYSEMFAGTDVHTVISDNPNITSMEYMFEFSNATSLDLSSFDTSKVTTMGFMFYGSQATNLDLSSFDTSQVTDMGYMLVSQATSLDLSSFDTSNVTTMVSMFSASQATNLDLSSFDTSKVTTMESMFRGSQATNLDLSSFDTSQVTDMRNMFAFSQATSGYAKTNADADRFNGSSNKPSGLTFTVKQ